MQSFVQARNTADDAATGKGKTDSGLEDLKVILHKKQSRERTTNIETQHGGIRGADTEKPFSYHPIQDSFTPTTDSTNLDTAGRTHPDIAPDFQHQPHANLQSFWSPRWQHDQDLTHERLESVKRRKVLDMKANGMANAYIKGDSYAETTSGRLSDLATKDIESQRVSQIWQPTTADHRQTYIRPSVETESLLPAPRLRPQQHGSAHQAHFTSEDEITSLEKLLPPFTRQLLPQQDQSIDRPVSRRKQLTDHVSPQVIINDHLHPLNHSTAPFTAGNKLNPSRNGIEQPMSSHDNIVPFSDLPQPSHITPEPNSRLYKKEYGTLQTQSFDEDSSSDQIEQVQPPEIPKISTLEELLILDEQNRTKHYMSLSIDAWEDAGTQLIQRFSDSLSDLTRIRRERRQAALMMEAELDQRHIVVTKKRKVTENSLIEMRSNGSQVLLRTPRKVST